MKCLCAPTKTQRHLIYNDLKRRKAANRHTGEAGTGECLMFVLEKLIKQFTDY